MPSTKRFKWVNGDTAAHDLLQLAYYAPQRISERALWLLLAFPSQSVVSDLIALALDTERNTQERDHTLLVISRVQGDLYAPELAPILEEDFIFQSRYIPANSELDKRRYDFSGLGRSLYEVILAHPENIPWFGAALERIEDPRYARDLLTCSFSTHSATNRLLAEWLVAFLKKHPLLFSDEAVNSVLIWFDRPEDSFSETLESLDLNDDQSPDVQLKYESSPVWKQLKSLYESALSGDYTAFNRIRNTALGWDVYLPLQGVATYFLGLLQEKYQEKEDVLWALGRLVKHPRDNWYSDDSGSSWCPVRTEAVSALYNIASPQAWEALIDGFFINPDNSLDYRFFDAIEYVTESLLADQETNAEVKKHQNLLIKKVKPTGAWFDALCNMDQDLAYYHRNWRPS